ncbi:MAG: hypothetical protein ACYDHP_12135 [Ferrimicrobium sp.]
MKKGRHRRYEEARKAKRGIPLPLVTCDECGGDALRGHAQWCLVNLEDVFDEVEEQAQVGHNTNDAGVDADG